TSLADPRTAPAMSSPWSCASLPVLHPLSLPSRSTPGSSRLHRQSGTSLLPALGLTSRPARSPALLVRSLYLFHSAQPPRAFLATSLPQPLVVWHSAAARRDRKSTRLNSSHGSISYAVFCLN